MGFGNQTTERTPMARKFTKLFRELENASAVKEKLLWTDAGYDGAKVRLETAMEAMKVALSDAAWGPCGSYFVRRYSRAIATPDYVTALVVNGLERVQVNIGPHQRQVDGWLRLIPLEEAIKMNEERRERNRQSDVRYKAALARCGDDLLAAGVASPKSFGDWVYEMGQEGGYFRLTTETSVSVSAVGALMATYAMTRGTAWELVPQY